MIHARDPADPKYADDDRGYEYIILAHCLQIFADKY